MVTPFVQALAVWLASLLVYCLFAAVEALRRRSDPDASLGKAVVGALLVYLVLLSVPSAIYLVVLTGVSQVLGATILYTPLLIAAIAMGAVIFYVGTRMSYMHEEGMIKHFALFFGITTFCWGVLGFVPAGTIAAVLGGG